MNGYIDSIETMGLVDGPGIRMVVFLRGCKLRCIYCHNPETWNIEAATSISSNEIVQKAHRNISYYKNGGITFSGGEPLLQPDFLLDCLKKCRELGIHTAIDTAGVGTGKYSEILDYTDLVILDIKCTNDTEYTKLTGMNMMEFNEFVHILNQKDVPLWIRHVIIPTINDTKEHIIEFKNYLKRFKNIEKVELLPYHLHGIEKYSKLNIPYKLEGIPALSGEKLAELNDILTK